MASLSVSTGSRTLNWLSSDNIKGFNTLCILNHFHRYLHFIHLVLLTYHGSLINRGILLGDKPNYLSYIYTWMRDILCVGKCAF